MLHAVLALACLFVPSALAGAGPRAASKAGSERSVPNEDVALVAVVNQVLPTALPADPTAAFVCVATWKLRLGTEYELGLAPGCPMPEEVRAAAGQWRFGIRGVPRGWDVITVSARLAYGPDQDGVVGWSHQMGADAPASLEPPEGGDASAPEPTPKVRVMPRFPTTAQRDGVTSAQCNARLTIDPGGVVTQVETDGCREDFQVATLDATAQWRFEPVVVAGVPQPATFKVQMTFRKRE